MIKPLHYIVIIILLISCRNEIILSQIEKEVNSIVEKSSRIYQFDSLNYLDNNLFFYFSDTTQKSNRFLRQLDGAMMLYALQNNDMLKNVDTAFVWTFFNHYTNFKDNEKFGSVITYDVFIREKYYQEMDNSEIKIYFKFLLENFTDEEAQHFYEASFNLNKLCQNYKYDKDPLILYYEYILEKNNFTDFNNLNVLDKKIELLYILVKDFDQLLQQKMDLLNDIVGINIEETDFNCD